MKRNLFAISIYSLLTILFMGYAVYGLFYPYDLFKTILGLGGATLTLYILLRYYLDKEDDSWMQQ